MTSENVLDDMSVTITSFFMKCSGFWLAADSVEQFRRNFALIYSIFTMVFGCWIVTTDFYYSRSNFGEAVYIACNILTLLTVLYKIFVLLLHRKEFLNLILYTQKNFWHSYGDEFENKVVEKCKRKCAFFVCSFTFFAQSTVCCYSITPIVDNLGRNESDRVLPFRLWVALPISLSPYFEIAFATQGELIPIKFLAQILVLMIYAMLLIVIVLYHIGICYFCFDNTLSIMNIHVTGQFRILQHRFILLSDGKNKSELRVQKDDCCWEDEGKRSAECYKKLKGLIRQHQALIEYCKKLESIFSFIILGQVLVFSLLICLVGIQILQTSSSPMRRAIFICHLSGTLCQLMMLTYSCDSLTEESGFVADASFASPWYSLIPDKAGRNLRNDIRLIIMRSRRPCCLTAGGFFPVSLETYTAVLSTATSYFTLLRRSTLD